MPPLPLVAAQFGRSMITFTVPRSQEADSLSTTGLGHKPAYAGRSTSVLPAIFPLLRTSGRLSAGTRRLYSRVVPRKDGRTDESCITAYGDLPSLPRRLRVAVSGVSALASFTLPRQGGCSRCRQGSSRTAAAVLAKRVGSGSQTASRRGSTGPSAARSAVG